MEDLQIEEDKVNHMQRLKTKIEQQLDDVSIIFFFSELFV